MRYTECTWTHVGLQKPKVVTGTDAAPVVSLVTHIRRELGFVAAGLARDTRPVLLYFHWPHAHEKHGKEVTKICTRVLEDEQVARWSKLFRCVRVEMEKSDLELAKRVGATKGPSLVVLNTDMKVVQRLEQVRSSPKLVKALKAAHASFPEAQKRLKGEVAAQQQLLATAQRLFDMGSEKHAREFLDRVRKSEVRVDPVYDEALELGKRLDTRAARAKRAK